MDRFLVPRPTPVAEEVLPAEVQSIVDAGLHRPKKKRKRSGTPWSKWGDDEKKECCKKFCTYGYMYLRNEYKALTPPPSTVRTWVNILSLKGQLKVPGRPRWLTDIEEQNLYRSIVVLRRHGCIVDRETLLVMAHAAVKLARGDSADLPPLTVHWCKAFRYVWCIISFVFFLVFQEEMEDWAFEEGYKYPSTPHWRDLGPSQ